MDYIKKFLGGSSDSKPQANPKKSLASELLNSRVSEEPRRQTTLGFTSLSNSSGGSNFKIFDNGGRKESETKNQSFEEFIKPAILSEGNTRKDEEKPRGDPSNSQKSRIFERPVMPLEPEQMNNDNIAEKSLNILQANQEAIIMMNDDERDLREVMREIEAHYFNELSEESLIKKELMRLPKVTRIDDVTKRVEVLDRYVDIIGKRLSKNALKNYEKFAEGLNNIDSISLQVNHTLDKIRIVREKAKNIKVNFFEKALKVSALSKKKKEYEKLLEFLMRFQKKFGLIYKNLNQTDSESSLLNAHNLIPVIKKAKTEFMDDKNLITKFVCLKNMDLFLDEKFEEIKDHVRRGIETTYRNFDEKKYFSLLRSYYHFEITYKECGPLMKEYPMIIHNNIKFIIKKCFEVISHDHGINMYIDQNLHIKANKLIHQIPKDHYIDFFKRLFHEFSNFLYNSHLCSRFHENNEEKIKAESKESKEFHQYFRDMKMQYLSHRKTIWQKIQTKTSKIMKSSNHITSFTPTDLVQFLEYCSKFVEIGEDFSASESKELKTTINDKFRLYFKNYQEKYLNDLKTIILNEEWKRLPLPGNYQVIQLINLTKTYNKEAGPRFSSLLDSKPQSREMENKPLSEFQNRNNALSSFGNPFDIRLEKGPKLSSKLSAKIPDKSLEDEDNDLDKSILMKKPASKPQAEQKNDFVICSASHHIVKGFENYILLMDILRPLLNEVFSGMMATIEYYIYAIVNIFSGEPCRKSLLVNLNLSGFRSNLKEEETNIPSLELQHDIYIYQTGFKNLKHYLSKIFDTFESGANKNSSLSLTTNNQIGFFTDFTERIVAGESLLFIHEYLKILQPLILKFSNVASTRDKILDYYITLANNIPLVKLFIYNSFMPVLLKHDNTFSSIPNLKWELKELTNDIQNIYTDRFAYFVGEQRDKLRSMGGGCIPQNVQEEVLRLVVVYCFRQLVDSFSKIKKCNQNGRTTMLMDYQQIVSRLEKMLDMKFDFGKEYVENFLNVWSKSVEEIVDFIISNSKLYPLKVHMSLINTSQSFSLIKRMQKKDLLNKIEREYYELLSNY